jgi:RNA polymerase sigma factor (sigma-70 family)
MTVGEEAAFVEFSNLFGPRLWVYFRRLGQSSADAEDLAVTTISEVSMRILQYTPRGSGQFSGWVFTLGFRLMIDWKRKTRRHQSSSSVSDDVVHPGSVADAADTADYDLAQRAELVGEVHAALETLKAIDRQILQLRDLGPEHSFEEIAQLLAITPGNARIRHHRALKKLETALSHLRPITALAIPDLAKQKTE